MKITVISLSLFSILMACMVGCKKENDCNKPTGIQGEWIWKESVGGFGGWTLTPESEKTTKKLRIDDFYFREYVNDSLVVETEYDLKISTETLLGTEEKTYIQFESGGAQAVIIGESELELIDQCFDCFSHKYSRK